MGLLLGVNGSGINVSFSLKKVEQFWQLFETPTEHTSFFLHHFQCTLPAYRHQPYVPELVVQLGPVCPHTYILCRFFNHVTRFGSTPTLGWPYRRWEKRRTRSIRLPSDFGSELIGRGLGLLTLGGNLVWRRLEI